MARVNTAGSLRRRRHARPDWIEAVARGGYFAKGAVFATVGLLTAMTAFGFAGGRITGTRGALTEIGSQSFGPPLLILLAAGLAGFVAWRVVQAVKDPERRGSDARALIERAGLLVSGLIYAGLAVFALRLLAGPQAGGDEGAREGAGWLMSQPLGTWLLGAIGALVITSALYQMYRVATASFRRQWDISEMSVREVEWATRISRIGIAARAVAMGLIGWFLIAAARQADPAEARGLEGALQAFAASENRGLWIAMIGLGLVCYGVYCFVNGRYKRISA